MSLRKAMPWAAAILSAALLELPFPLAGPMPPWRGLIAFVALVPLLWAILTPTESPRPLRHSFLLGYLCGILWYAGNCYWIYDTMLIHGGVPPAGSVGLLFLYSLVLGLYFGLFALGVKFIADSLGLTITLFVAPYLWTALDLAAARITSVPWDQLGYSQVDNIFLGALAPFTGVYGITFVLVLINTLIVGAIFQRETRILRLATTAILAAMSFFSTVRPAALSTSSASAILLQPNLDVSVDNRWNSPQLWNSHISQFISLANDRCQPSTAGIPQTNAPEFHTACPTQPPPGLIVWPEAPSLSFYEADSRFTQTMSSIARDKNSALIIGGIGSDLDGNNEFNFNSAMLWASDGSRIGRYDKIHLVPYGEFVPYRELFFFAHKLTSQVGDFSRGIERKSFLLTDRSGQSHRYGIFICYESVFADEIRHFVLNGAEVLVNISDDGWYGDTSAPWQHLNMARMRAIENRRWILRDTNTGVTSVIDPYGHVRQSIPRHTVGALVAQYGFNSETTFYTRHGDVFAWACAILSIGFVVWAFSTRRALKVQIKSGPEQIS
jgi:apolipoprotein N-acyltransferase